MPDKIHIYDGCITKRRSAVNAALDDPERLTAQSGGEHKRHINRMVKY